MTPSRKPASDPAAPTPVECEEGADLQPMHAAPRSEGVWAVAAALHQADMSWSALSVANLEETLRCASAAEEMSRSWVASYGDTQKATELLEIAKLCLFAEGRLAALPGREIVALVVSCLSVELLPPSWLSRAFSERALAVLSGDANNWNAAHAFGNPRPAGVGVPALQNRLVKGPRAYAIALDLLEQSKGGKVPGGLEWRVSEAMGISVGTAKSLLESAQAHGDRPDLSAVRRELQAGCSLQVALIRVISDRLHQEWLEKEQTHQDWLDQQDRDAAEDLK